MKQTRWLCSVIRMCFEKADSNQALGVLNEQDMFGMARGYELYGYLNDTYTWKKGEEKKFYESWY